MKAIVVADDQSLSWSEVEAPTPGAGEVLIAVKATAINRADLLQRQGGYPPPPGASPVLGLECAGDVNVGVWPFCGSDCVSGKVELACFGREGLVPEEEGLDAGVVDER